MATTWKQWHFDNHVPSWSPEEDGDGMIAIEQHTADNGHLESRLDPFPVDDEPAPVRKLTPGFAVFEELHLLDVFDTLEAAQAWAAAYAAKVGYEFDIPELRDELEASSSTGTLFPNWPQ